jgi:hypothetical protein
MISERSAPSTACVHQVMRAFVLSTLLAGAPVISHGQEPASSQPVKAAPVESTPRTYSAETPWFSILGDDARANNAVAPLATRVGRELERNGFTTADFAPNRVTVYVNSGDGDIALNTAGAQTSVRIPRRLLNDERPVAEALARAALTRLAQAAGRTAAPADHAVESLAWEARASGSPGMTEHLARRAKAAGPVSIETLAAPANPAGAEVHGVSAFWLHRAMREDRRGDPRAALAEAAAGIPLNETLVRMVPDVAAGGARAAAWWPTAFYRQTSSRVPPVETVAESQTRLRDISRFVIAENGADHALDAAGIIARRQQPELMETVRTRLVELKTDLPRTNPVWQNAFIAHGLFLEKIATGEPAELQQLDVAARAEAEVARRTSDEIVRSLADSK